MLKHAWPTTQSGYIDVQEEDTLLFSHTEGSKREVVEVHCDDGW